MKYLKKFQQKLIFLFKCFNDDVIFKNIFCYKSNSVTNVIESFQYTLVIFDACANTKHPDFESNNKKTPLLLCRLFE